MLRIALSAVLGAVVCFAWNWAAWMATPLHDGAIRPFPDERLFMAALRQQALATGVYVYPTPAQPAADADQATRDQLRREFEERHRAGPMVAVFYASGGTEPMSPAVLAIGFAINLLGATISALLVAVGARAGLGYLGRAEIVAGLGLFLAVVGHGGLWNWMRFPAEWTVPMMVDVLIAWTLVGLVQAAIIRPEPTPPPAVN
jgi:hypothetical protein